MRLSGSIHLVSLVAIGEYVGKICLGTKRRPGSIIRDRAGKQDFEQGEETIT